MEAVVSAENREGTLIGVGDGVVTGEEIQGKIRWALDSGANSVYGVNFDVLDKTEVLEEARKLAVENAQKQAE